MKIDAILNQGLVFAAATVVSIASIAAECVPDSVSHLKTLVGKSSSGAITTNSYSEWEDWIWRGPIFQCNGDSGGGDCTYRWDQTNYKEYSWGVGVSLNLGGVPVIGPYVGPFTPSATYTKTKGWSQTFAWSQIIRPGYFAQPVQVVRRRWSEGYFRGANRLVKNSSCNNDNGSWYNWDGAATFGHWGAQTETSRFAKYHIWR